MRTGPATFNPLLGLILLVAAFVPAAVQAAALQNPELAAHREDADDGAGVKSGALAIGKLDIDVAITGNAARTVVTAKFLNAGRDVLEGNFVFDLPRGSVVTGYALDVGDAMVDGVLVGRRQGLLTYESRVRRGIDPGLAEVTRSGAFMTRVYPILSGKGRTVRLEFVTPLDHERSLAVPLLVLLPIPSLTIHVTTDAANPPSLKGPDGVELTWRRSGRGFEAHASAQNSPLSGALVVGPADAPAVHIARHGSGDAFFEIDDLAPPANSAAVRPERLRIYWDSSLSRRAADLGREIDLAARAVAELRPQDVDLVFFSAGASHVRSFHAPSAAAIAAVLKTTDYQGGTSLVPVLHAALPAAGLCLLFSDGNITVDSYRAERLPCPLFTVSSVADAGRALLDALARKSAGDYLDLTVQDGDAALARLLHPVPRVLEVKDSAGRDLDAVLLPAAGRRLRLIGRLPAAGDVVVTLGGVARGTRVYPLDRAAIAADDGLGALWAARRLDEMSATDRPDQDALLALSRRYSVASPAASFVVFENIEDYVEAGAEPPASLGKDKLAEYRKRKAARDAEHANAQRRRLDDIVKLWSEQKEWWQKRFKPLPRAPKPAPFGLDMPRPQADLAPPPPMPNVVMPAPAMSGGAAVESVIVTGSRAPTRAATIEIAIAPWNPDRPYIKALSAAQPEAFWSVYRRQEAQFGTLPAFYLDVAEFLFRHGKTADAITVALNALELPAAGTTTMTILADRLMRYGDETRALWLYERLLYLEPDRPQPRRNLALALMARADRPGPAAERRRDYGRALGLLNEIVTHDWQDAFQGIEVISLMEANRIVPRLKQLGVTRLPLDKRLVALLDVDLRIVLEWNTDQTDMDLWVDEPTGERAIYNHPKTGIGGRLSNDMTNGYGPEEYLLHRAPDGTYTVRVNVYNSDSLSPNGATTVRARIFRNYGRANEREETLELELKRADGERDSTEHAHLVGTIKVTGK
ncbi:MAG: VIT domain-containing protein [Rhizomicrobium sp.]